MSQTWRTLMKRMAPRWRAVVMDGAEIAEVWVAALVQELNPKGNVLRDPLVTTG